MRKHSRSLVVILLAVIAMGMWLLFAAQLSLHELLLGVVFAVLATWISLLAWHQTKVRFHPTTKHLVACWRLPWYVIADCWEICVVLLRDLAGKRAGSFFRVTPFRADTNAEGDAQNILATTYSTASPNFIVIGIDRNRLFFHQIARSDVPRMIDELEAGK